MSKTLSTNLQHFRYNTDEQHQQFSVEWFCFDSEAMTARGFSEEELKLFIDYVVTNRTNFDGGKNYHELPDDFEPINLERDSFRDEEKQIYPEYLVLKSNQIVTSRKEVRNIMDILLITSEGVASHNYNLPFSVVGKLV